MSAANGYVVIIVWRDGGREAVSDHATLQLATREAFGLADRLSLPGPARPAAEVGVFKGDQLQLSITIIPGEGLVHPGDRGGAG